MALRFASSKAALQHLANITGRRVKVAVSSGGELDNTVNKLGEVADSLKNMQGWLGDSASDAEVVKVFRESEQALRVVLKNLDAVNKRG